MENWATWVQILVSFPVVMLVLWLGTKTQLLIASKLTVSFFIAFYIFILVNCLFGFWISVIAGAVCALIIWFLDHYGFYKPK